MKALIVLSLLAITLNHVNGDELQCASSLTNCANHNISSAKTCNEKLPFFNCLINKGCSEKDDFYKTQEILYNYQGCGASAIIMGWILPILMFSLAKYFSNH